MSRRTVLAGALATAVAAACGSESASLATDGSLPAGARVRVLRHDGEHWWAAGSVRAATGATTPALWRSDDARRWTALRAEPSSYYGGRNELTALAVDARTVVAVGEAIGGVHGNARRSWWRVEGNRVVEQPSLFETFGGPNMIGLRDGAASGGVPVFIGTRAAVRTGRVGAAVWRLVGDDLQVDDDVPGLWAEPGEQSAGLGLTVLPDGRFLAVGDGFRTDTGDATTHPRVWTSTDTAAWQRVELAGDLTDTESAVSLQRVAVAQSLVVAVGTRTTSEGASLLAWVTDPALGAGSVRVLDVLGRAPVGTIAAATGVAVAGRTVVVAGRLDATPVVARSDDAGVTWRRLRLPAALPSGVDVDVAVAASLASARPSVLVAAADPDHAALASGR